MNNNKQIIKLWFAYWVVVVYPSLSDFSDPSDPSGGYFV